MFCSNKSNQETFNKHKIWYSLPQASREKHFLTGQIRLEPSGSLQLLFSSLFHRHFEDKFQNIMILGFSIICIDKIVVQVKFDLRTWPVRSVIQQKTSTKPELVEGVTPTPGGGVGPHSTPRYEILHPFYCIWHPSRSGLFHSMGRWDDVFVGTVRKC